ncbi:MAG TPA: DUF1800 domain-containing protein [Candidatus Angelobacter sp.]|jgi:uncharacterized protein (DUF1800 family)|nr:DUF1800 domain-containing protein [Candidatus Angelobacter sp.]
MPAVRKQVILLGLIVLISTAVLFAGDKKSKSKPPDSNAPAVAQMQMDDDKRIVHALNRFTFGVRPSDVERVRNEGLDKWFDEQLHPEKIDDGAVESRLVPFRTLKMSTKEMVENFPPPQVLKAIENGRMSMPHDPAKKAVYESRMAAYQQREQNKEDKAASNAGDNNTEKAAASSKPAVVTGPVADNTDAAMEMSSGNKAPLTAEQSKDQKIREDAMYTDLDTDRLLKLPPDERYKAILKMPVDERLDLAKTYKGPRAMQLVDDMKPEQRETVEAMIQPQAVLGELAEAKLLRAIYSNRQLDEVMTDFWFNHFNVFIGKGPDRYMINAYEREVIRPHALGKFKDILAATAKSPAMLFYLDNWQSVGPDSELALYGPQRRVGRRGRFARPRPQQGKNRPSGLNENYAREIMELHTLGVDGGYTQKDVTELAKVLTGWTIQQPQMGGGFKFNERAHEPGPKYILGRKIGEHGEKEGEEMLDILAHHPSTAKFISRKLAMRFVSDNPPQALVDRMAETFVKKDGDIREVLRTMFRSPEFWAADAYRAKMKTPFEFVASAARASGADIQNAMPLVGTLNRMGMPLYAMQPPTGYSMKAEAWVNSSALLNRMNFALQLASGKLPGTSLNPQGLIPGPPPADSQAALAALEQSILAGDVSPQTHAVMQKQLGDPQIAQRRLDDVDKKPNYGAIAGLIMGSPEFQRR